jgi:hypothetical protein
LVLHFILGIGLTKEQYGHCFLLAPVRIKKRVRIQSESIVGRGQAFALIKHDDLIAPLNDAPK